MKLLNLDVFYVFAGVILLLVLLFPQGLVGTLSALRQWFALRWRSP